MAIHLTRDLDRLPSTVTDAPAIQLARGDARKVTSAATSSARPKRPNGSSRLMNSAMPAGSSCCRFHQDPPSKLIEPGYAYFRVSQFQEHTGETLAKSIETLFKQNEGPMKGIVLDLRNDPGGLLNGAVAVSSAFLPAGALSAR